MENSTLKKLTLFEACTDQELTQIGRAVFEKEYRQGATLFVEGMTGGIMYLLVRGRISIFKRKGTKEVEIAAMEAGDFVGEMSLIDEEPRSASAKVTEDATLVVITKKSFRDILQASPQAGNKILLSLLKSLSRRLRETNRRLVI
jgi:CRP/FNR family transcriptional regulator, cyclic AMP receptor protein